MPLDINFRFTLVVEPVTVVLQLDPALVKQLAGPTEQLDRIERKLQAMSDEQKALWKQVDDETTRIATLLEKELADEPEALSKIQTHLNSLKGIGSNPSNPLPEAPAA